MNSSNTKDIYLIRHGETEFNKMKMVQGSGVDASLNDKGSQQAQAFYAAFADADIERVFTSKLKRTHQSVAQFIDSGLPWEQLEGLNEISWGYKEGKVITDKDDNQYFEMLNAWQTGDLTQKVPGGESPLEVSARQKVAWEQVIAAPEQRILVCMHGRAMRILLSYLLDTELKDMNQYPHRNLCLYHLRYENGKYTAMKSNCVKHLEVLEEQVG